MIHEGQVVDLSETVAQLEKKGRDMMNQREEGSVHVVMQPADGRVSMRFCPEDFVTEVDGVGGLTEIDGIEHESTR